MKSKADIGREEIRVETTGLCSRVDTVQPGEIQKANGVKVSTPVVARDWRAGGGPHGLSVDADGDRRRGVRGAAASAGLVGGPPAGKLSQCHGGGLLATA